MTKHDHLGIFILILALTIGMGIHFKYLNNRINESFDKLEQQIEKIANHDKY